MANIEVEAITITYIVKIIPAKLTLGIKDSAMNIAAATIYVNSLESAISITRKAAGL